MESSIFTKNLIEKTITCFKEEDGLDLSPEQASEYLNSLASLFLAFSEHSKPRPAPKAGGALSSDLITPHSCNN